MRRMELETIGTGDLLRRLIDNVQTIADREVRLIREEVRENVSDTLQGSKLMMAGSVLLYAGGILLLVCLALALASIVPPWATTLALGLLFAAVGGGLVLSGKRQLATEPLQKTRESLEEDIEWARRQIKSNGR